MARPKPERTSAARTLKVEGPDKHGSLYVRLLAREVRSTHEVPRAQVFVHFDRQGRVVGVQVLGLP